MNKAIKVIASVGFFGFAILLLMVFVISERQSASKKPVDYEQELLTLENDESLCFDSLQEYETYLCANAEADSEISYRYPASLPNDMHLCGITVDKEGTIFYFELNRDYEAEPIDAEMLNRTLNVIHCENSDYILQSLVNIAIYKEYGPSFDFISDRRKFAENLASDLGAQLVNSRNGIDTYTGAIYTNSVFGTNGDAVEVGLQKVEWEYVPSGLDRITYNYIPNSLTESERNAFTNLVEHYVVPQSNNN